MAVIPLIRQGDNKTVVETEQAFAAAGGLEGRALLIQGLDPTQLSGNTANATYDLRVGREYRDHRGKYKETLPQNGTIKLQPGAAVIIETEELLHLPRSMFGYIIPKVGLLQKGLSNTSSKVDPGYDGRLLVTVFNLGKKTEILKRHECFCALCILQVADGASLYQKEEKRIETVTERRLFRGILDTFERHTALIVTLVGILSVIINTVLTFWGK